MLCKKAPPHNTSACITPLHNPCPFTQTGYWDNIDNLDQELTLFVAANWTRFPDPDTPGQHYWYNQVHACARW